MKIGFCPEIILFKAFLIAAGRGGKVMIHLNILIRNADLSSEGVKVNE